MTSTLKGITLKGSAELVAEFFCKYFTDFALFSPDQKEKACNLNMAMVFSAEASYLTLFTTIASVFSTTISNIYVLTCDFAMLIYPYVCNCAPSCMETTVLLLVS